MILYVLVAAMFGAVVALQFWIVAKMTEAAADICKTVAKAGICIKHEYKMDTPQPQVHEPTQEEIDYEKDQQKIIDAAMALQGLFLDADVLEGVKR